MPKHIVDIEVYRDIELCVSAKMLANRAFPWFLKNRQHIKTAVNN